MSFELDHILICAPFGAPMADRLVTAGFTEGSPNQHPGQGTANRRFFFDNAFMEFIWVVDEGEIRSDLVGPTKLWERMTWRTSGASPFEICIRPSDNTSIAPPFSTFSYRPHYLPPGDEIPMADAVPLDEPGSFINLAGAAPSRNPDNTQPLDHPNGARTIDAIALTAPRESTSDVGAALSRLGIASYSVGTGHAIEVAFGGGAGNDSFDLRPDLPVLLSW